MTMYNFYLLIVLLCILIIKRYKENQRKWNIRHFVKGDKLGIYSYFNIEKFIPFEVIKRKGPVKNFENDPDPHIGKIRIRDLSFDEYMEKSDIAGIIIIKKGKVVYEKYNKMKADEKRIWMSTSKILVSYIIALLELQGMLDIEIPVDNYIAELKGTGWEGIKVKDILNMSSGIEYIDGRGTKVYPWSKTFQFYKAELGNYKKTYLEMLYEAKGNKTKEGQVFQYSSANTEILALLAEKITNKKFSRLLYDKVWSQIGAEGEAILGMSKEKVPLVHGILASRLSDMARVASLFTQSDNSDLEEILDKIYINTDTSKYYKGQGKIYSKYLESNPIGNAYQWDAVFEDGDLYKAGLNGQGIYVSPKEELIAVWFADKYPKGTSTEAFIHKIFMYYKYRGKSSKKINR